MKKFLCWAAILCLILSGCAKELPAKAADGADWEESWTTLGSVLGVEEPGHGLVLRDNNEALSVTDMYLATWTIGDPSPYVNEDEDEVDLYPARLDVLVYGRRDGDAARQVLEDWSARQAQTYDVNSTCAKALGGQDYTVSAYICKSETNPYGRGVSAFTVYQDYAVSLELNCLDSFAEDETAILSDFLEHCHYAA